MHDGKMIKLRRWQRAAIVAAIASSLLAGVTTAQLAQRCLRRTLSHTA
jgi:hypothetical protein